LRVVGSGGGGGGGGGWDESNALACIFGDDESVEEFNRCLEFNRFLN
jgi:hypothetical protein